MRRRHTEEQILGILHEADAGRKVDELCRAHDVSRHTFYRWKAKYGGLQLNEAKRLRQLEDENRKLKTIVADLTRGSEPWFVLTGHTLMVGDMGWTELATSAEIGANALFESAARLRALPDHVEVWPGAFAGSVCGRRLSGKPASTIGFERRFNRAFATEERDAFVELMLADIPARPENADQIRAENLQAVREAVVVRQ